MARQQTVYSVFVGSPSDVNDERVKLEEVIKELNLLWSREFGLQLELIKWETHTFPGIGDDAQSLINEQVPDDYDLFIGIMWHRYGTPTGRSGSGTIEEFEHAKARYEADPASIKIMIYFKDQAVPPSSMDPVQLAKVKEFRGALGDEGCFYWTFESLGEFEQLLRMHLVRQVQTWRARQDLRHQSSNSVPSTKCLTDTSDREDIEDFGAIDLIELFETQFLEIKAISSRISEAIDELGARISDRVGEVEVLNRNSDGRIDRVLAKKVMSSASDDMNQFSESMCGESHKLNTAFEIGIDAFVRYLALSTDFEHDESHENDISNTLDSVRELIEVMEESGDSMFNLRASILDIPRLTSELNRAKRSAASTVDDLSAALTRGRRLLGEVEKALLDFN